MTGRRLLLPLAALLLYLALERLVAAGLTDGVDRAVLYWVHAHTAPVPDAMALAGVVLGSGTLRWVALLAGSLLLWRLRDGWSILLLWVALAPVYLQIHLLKSVSGRARPRLFGPHVEALGMRFAYPESPSFPSGHALTAMVVYGTLAYLVARREPTPGQRRATLAAAGALVAVTGLSRVYLGVHYPSDVLGGFLAGAAWTTACVAGVEALRGRRPG